MGIKVRNMNQKILKSESESDEEEEEESDDDTDSEATESKDEIDENQFVVSDEHLANESNDDDYLPLSLIAESDKGKSDQMMDISNSEGDESDQDAEMSSESSSFHFN